MRIAIIDIGTNSINLVMAEARQDGTYSIIWKSKETARLGRGGINTGMLTPEAMQRGLDAIGRHMETIGRLGGVDRVLAIGTSAMRATSNGAELARQITEKYGIEVRIISGEEEAQLIFDGVKQVMPLGRERVLVLDIGGGSCEFIIANKDGIVWKHSYELGMARILDLYKPSDPITTKEITAIEAFIRKGVMSHADEENPQDMNLYEALQAYPTSTLIGTSGSFSTMAALVAGRNHPWLKVGLTTSYEIPLSNFEETYRKMIGSTQEQRLAMKQMDPARVDIIVPGVIFINFVISELKMEKLYQCGFALKEGAISRMIEESQQK